MTEGYKWPAIAIQGIILSNIILIGVSRVISFNVFLLISAVIILSLFILQSISRRFLLLFPYNQIMNVEIQSIDTHILRVFLITSIFCFFIGLINFKVCNQIFIDIDANLLCFFYLLFIFFISFFFLIFVPIIWILFLREMTIKQIVNKLKKTKFEREIHCPVRSCDGKAKLKRNVLSRFSYIEIIQCEKCGFKIEEEKNIIIAFGT